MKSGIFSKHRPGADMQAAASTLHISSGMMSSSKIQLSSLESVLWAALLTAVFLPGWARGQARDLVSGNLVQFNDNGAWCWFQNERAVVDAAKGNLIISSDACEQGLGGYARHGTVEVVIYDLETGSWQRKAFKSWDDNHNFYADDHNAAGLLIRPDGRYLAVYTAHNTEKYSYWRVFDGTNWGSDYVYDWNTQPGGADFNTTYSDPYYLSAEARTYDFARGALHGSPNMIISTNYGDTWAYGGVLCTNQNVGYVNGYFNYWGNGVDRIDFVCTEYHPRNYNTSIYHGYVSNGMSFKSDGTLVDGNIFNKLAPTTPDFTQVFAANTVQPPGQTNSRCWNFDVQRYDDGTIAILFKTRINDNPSFPSSDPNHAFFYARYDGSSWSSTYLCKAGKKMYGSEEDYTGLGALCPNDPNTIFVSTPIDPRNGSNLTVHEIFKGVTSDRGATWTWTPVTMNSVRDNYRPIVPAWDGNNMVVLWWRGTYTAAQNFDAAVVGIVTYSLETNGLMHYVDATTNNTFLTNGAQLVLSSALNQWHLQTGVGNGGTVMSSADSTGENAPNIMTQVTVPGSGTYDVWANFWGNPAADWRIRAGLTESNMQTYRSMACAEVQPGYHDTGLVLTNSTPANNYLYQAFVGRVVISNNYTITVLVDDNARPIGTSSTLVGNTCRTWYDGVSYAGVVSVSGLPYDQWIAGYGLAGSNALAGFDYDNDGWANVFEFVLGGNPTLDDSSVIRPTYNLDVTYFEYDFRRLDASHVPLGYAAEVYYSTDLVSWTKAVNGVNGIVISEQDDFYGSGVDKVSARLPYALAPEGRLFVRLAVSPVSSP